ALATARQQRRRAPRHDLVARAVRLALEQRADVHDLRFGADLRAPLLRKVQVVLDERVLGVLAAADHAAAAVGAGGAGRPLAAEVRVGRGFALAARLAEVDADLRRAERSGAAQLPGDLAQRLVGGPQAGVRHHAEHPAGGG